MAEMPCGEGASEMWQNPLGESSSEADCEARLDPEGFINDYVKIFTWNFIQWLS